ncbi:WRKY transcription factor 51 [Actinidia chinensis var. chinensis]|uniref:WRKY transcription factor 51 n=1 Tax=Actinidia chinensis var. chinensis TaxID=1590841 RepID=A0A2R6RKB2_ACTCC|nr:WRKY transcription factor 51 [Actinidia chinensis var. chinensis]
MDHHPHLQNPNPNSTHLTGNIDTWLDFEVEDYLVLDDGSEESFSSQNMASSDNVTGGFESASAGATSSNSNIKRKNGVNRRKPDHAGVRVAFRTKSELEVMDDGFKWRKYGKKMVKNSPNPRNYYKCSSGGCNVKKRVERDREDPSYVITTYDGVHNHESPCVFYYNHTPLMVPNGWTLQPSPS